MKQYVRQKNNLNARLWEIYVHGRTDQHSFTVMEQQNCYTIYYTLPKSEYELVDPPIAWKNVTRECRYSADFNRGTLIHEDYSAGHLISYAVAEMFDSTKGLYRFVKTVLHLYAPGGTPDAVRPSSTLVDAYFIEKKEEA